ncbi:MAG: hypothetical protein R3E48_22090 [Burkholderiaceae bacterium]
MSATLFAANLHSPGAPSHRSEPTFQGIEPCAVRRSRQGSVAS